MTVRKLCPELQDKAIRDLGEDPKRVLDDIRFIKQWLQQQPHLNAYLDDQFILNYLRGSKFSLHEVQQKLETYYTIRSEFPAIFTDRDPFHPEIQEMLSYGLVFPLPKTVTKDGPRIIFFNYGDGRPELLQKISLINGVKLASMCADILYYEDDNFIISGQQGFVDLTAANSQDVQMSQVAKVNPFPLIRTFFPLVKKAKLLFKNGYFMNPVRCDVINPPLLWEMAYDLILDRIKNPYVHLIHVHSVGEEEEVFKAVPRSVLPNELGGDCGSIKELAGAWKKKVESYSEWFKEQDKYGCDETKRLFKSKIDFKDSAFGVEGTFRKIVDE